MDVKYKVTWQETNDFGDMTQKNDILDSIDEARERPTKSRGTLVPKSINVVAVAKCPHCAVTGPYTTTTMNMRLCDSCCGDMDYPY